MNEKKEDNLLLKSHRRTEHPFTMYESIHVSPEILRGCLKDDVVKAIQDTAEEIEKCKIDNIVFTGTGTSYFSGLVGVYALNEMAGMQGSTITSHEFKNYVPAGFGNKSALVGISHSGSTLVGTQSNEIARKLGALVVSITDVEDSPMAKTSDLSIVGPGGRDMTIPKTRSYMSGVFRTLMLCAAIGEHKKPGTWDKWMDEFKRVPDVVEEALSITDKVIQDYAKQFLQTRAFYCISYGANVCTAQEASLKLLEGSLSMAIGLQAEEAIHGPLAAVDSKCALVLIAPNGKGYERVERIAKGMHYFGVPIFGMGDPDASIKEDSNFFIGIPGKLHDLFATITYIPTLYLLSYWIAVHKGINPDILKSDNTKWVEAMGILMPPGSH
ncbi:MAG: SIS domain-containing protein [Chloroflexi bacterium]|nr:SIS domain-containing protein [Chloroflexota bacterium]